MADPAARPSVRAGSGRGTTLGLGATLGWGLVSLATALALLGLAIVPFLTPTWIHAEQARAGSAALTGYSVPVLSSVTDSIVHDLVLGGSFDASAPAPGCPTSGLCAAVQVLDPREVAHMEDVRGVFGGLAALVGIALVGLVGAAAWTRGKRASRATWWRAVGRGGHWLAIAMVVAGAVSLVAFDAAFELFHELLFPAGSFDFDPRTERLVQLFPDQFWSDTALALGGVAIVLSLVVAWLGARRARDLARVVPAAGAPSPLPTALPRGADR